MPSQHKSCELILALDVDSLSEGKALLNKIGPSLQWVKIGLELFTRFGPDVVKVIADMGYRVFLDLKLYDIPNQVAGAIRSLRDLPVGMLTLHASGGAEMMRWANESCEQIGHPMKLLGVTVLTSFDQPGLRSIGVEASPEEQVLRLGQLALDSGLQGLVCSPLELSLLRKKLGPKTILVTPGIRPLGFSPGEQKRVMTPQEAVRAGASYIVVGRPILEAENAAQVVQSILVEMHTKAVHYV